MSDYDDRMRELMLRKMDAEAKRAEIQVEIAQVELETARMIRERHRTPQRGGHFE